MPLNPLNNHYAMENPASVYDEEAMTALELAGRTTAKVNETVQAFNDLESQTNEHLDNQDQTIDNRLTAQDNRITTMNNVTMPAKVKSEMQRRIDNGEFTAEINTYAGNLEARVDNLLGTVQEGSTTMDAEIIDGRTGADGTVYPNTGTAIREQVANLHRTINSGLGASDMTFFRTGPQLFNKNDPGVLVGQYLGDNDTLMEAENNFQTHLIRVEPGKTYTSNVCSGRVNWYNDLKVYIGMTTSQTFRADCFVTAPSGAHYARFIGFVSGTDTFYNETDIDRFGVWEGTEQLNVFHFEQYIPDEVIGFRHVPKYALDVIVNDSVNIIDKNDPNNLHDAYYNIRGILSNEFPGVSQTGLVPVEPGATYKPSNTTGLVVFYDKFGRYCGGRSSKDIGLDGNVIIIPDNVYYARFTTSSTLWDTFMVVKGDTLPDSYVPGNYKVIPGYLPAGSLDNNLGIRFTSYGDSITARNGWQPRLAEYYSMNHTNLGIGSTCMAYVSEVESTLPCLVNADRIQAVKDSDPDVITILGGANDAVRSVPVGTEAELAKGSAEKDKTTFIGALSYLVSTLTAWKPTLNIILITQPVTNVSGYTEAYKGYAEATRKVAEWHGVHLVDMAREIGYAGRNVTTYTSDGVHPNEAGNLKLANAVGAKIADIYRMR